MSSRSAVGLALAAVAWVLIAGLDPWTISPEARFAPPSATHPLGTDEYGRDAMARLVLGVGVSGLVAITGAVLAVAIGGAFGLAAGLRGGWVDVCVRRVLETVQAVPKLPLFLLLASVDVRRFGLSPGWGWDLTRLALLFGLFGWMTAARVVRAQTRELAASPFVEASFALGAPARTVAIGHMVPHVWPTLKTVLAFDFTQLLLMEAALSFLGLGVPAPLPSLGTLTARGLAYAVEAPWLLLGPGLASAWLVASVGRFLDAERKMAVEAPQPSR